MITITKKNVEAALSRAMPRDVLLKSFRADIERGYYKRLLTWLIKNGFIKLPKHLMTREIIWLVENNKISIGKFEQMNYDLNLGQEGKKIVGIQLRRFHRITVK